MPCIFSIKDIKIFSFMTGIDMAFKNLCINNIFKKNENKQGN